MYNKIFAVKGIGHFGYILKRDFSSNKRKKQVYKKISSFTNIYHSFVC